MPVTNKKSKEEIKKDIDDVLEETPPDINEPIVVEPQEEPQEEVTPVEPIEEVPPAPESEIKKSPPFVSEPEPELPVEVKEVPEPTEEDLKAFVRGEGSDWDELTNWEKALAKRTYLTEKKLEAMNEGFQAQKKQSEWSKKLDTFIETTDGKPEYTKLSGHEAEFKRFAMQHPENDIQNLLLPAFLHNLPETPLKRGSLMEHGGGGLPPEKPKEGIDDADLAKKLRESDPREYARQLKAGKIKISID
jgi:hypothetical protein